MAIGNFWIKTPIFNPPIIFLHRYTYMHECDICQYLICQNVFCTISPKFTLTNNSSNTVSFKVRYRPDATSHSRLTRECVTPAWNNCEWSSRVKCARKCSLRVVLACIFTCECSSRVVLASVFHSRAFTGLHLCSNLELETINR